MSTPFAVRAADEDSDAGSSYAGYSEGTPVSEATPCTPLSVQIPNGSESQARQQPVRKPKIVFSSTFNGLPQEKGEPVTLLASLLKRERTSARCDVTAMSYDGDPDLDDVVPTASGSKKKKGQRRTLSRQPEWLKWVLTALAAVTISLQCGVMLHGEHLVTHWRLHLVEHLQHEGHMASALVVLLGYGLVASFIASLMVIYVSPRAASSGIPDIKAYLNGNNLPGALSFRTWVARSVGLFLVTSAGLFAGTEGPFAHLGAIVASGIAKGRFKEIGVRMPWRMAGQRTQYEFISMGAAMGVSAAFGAPVGGILFSLEEASTFWSDSLTRRCFFGSVVASLIARGAKTGFGGYPLTGFIEFPDSGSVEYRFWEIIPFLFIGVLTGLWGGLFCAVVRELGHLRKRLFPPSHPRTPRLKILEVLGFATLILLSCFFAPMAWGCSKMPYTVDDSSRHLSGEDPFFVGLQSRGPCHEGEYSPVATVLMQPKSTAIKALFTKSFEGGADFTIADLIFTGLIISVLTVTSYGMAVPYGLFIPNIMIGACFGRATGEVTRLITGDEDIHVGVYALIGAAGQLGGFSRMTVSLTMIVLEISGNVPMILPLMLTIMTSKAVGDCLTESVYDIGIEMNKQIHMLEGEWHEDDDMTISDICNTEVTVLHSSEEVGQVVKLLTHTKYHAYPIVSGKDSQVVGVIQRHKLVQLVSRQKASALEEGMIVNLVPLADVAPCVKHYLTPLARAFHHFQVMGLQHLCVVDEAHCLRGLATRSDFSRLSHAEGRAEILETMRRRHYEVSAATASATDSTSQPAFESEADARSDSSSHSTQTSSKGDSSAPSSLTKASGKGSPGRRGSPGDRGRISTGQFGPRDPPP